MPSQVKLIKASQHLQFNKISKQKCSESRIEASQRRALTYFFFFLVFNLYWSGLPWWLRWQRIHSNAGDLGSIPGLGGSPRGRLGNPLQHSCLKNPTARGTFSPPGSSVHGILPARILEWVAISSSRGPSRSRDQTCVCCGSCIG